MSEVFKQLQNLNTLSFEDTRNALAYVGMAALPVAAVVSTADYYRKPKTSEDGLIGADPVALEAMGEVKDRRFSEHRKRWSGLLTIAAGVSLLSVNGLEPTLEYETTVPGVESQFVLDGSYSMALTSDMAGLTRFEAAQSAINGSLESFLPDQKAGLVLFGANAEAVAPLSTSHLVLSEGFSNIGLIDANGADLTTAIDLASNLLVGSENAGSDTLFVITDGTVDDAGSSVARLNQLAEDGTNVEVIVTGTEEGSYTRTSFDSVPIDSSIRPDAFENQENISLNTAQTSDEIQAVINDVTKRETQDTERRSTDLFTIAGITLITAGAIKELVRKWKKRI